MIFGNFFRKRGHKKPVREYTPENISSLKPNEVFVFGSNLAGHHGGGAARAALHKFGAIMGHGAGLQGQSYGIPTMQGGIGTIKPYVDEFISFAKAHSELKFYVTRIGCGIAGFRDEEIAPLFQAASGADNIILPKSFADIIELKLPSDKGFIKGTDSRPETVNVTPHWISGLKDDEIFVFGCRRSGRHYEGAANFARENFGAVVGQGEGLQGQSYAIPTAGVGLGWIRHAVDRFTEFASANPNLKFLVTPVGCGLGLWDYEDIAPLFRNASKLPNVWLPEEFWNELYK